MYVNIIFIIIKYIQLQVSLGGTYKIYFFSALRGFVPVSGVGQDLFLFVDSLIGILFLGVISGG